MTPRSLAAVDLGSNSFRLLIGRVQESPSSGASIFPMDNLKETVRLAAGLSADKVLDDAAISRALEVLRRFSERLRSFAPEQVRAVATNTFRVARNVKQFLPLAEEALGFPIEIIGGREEARLIYGGVAHSLPPSTEDRLVVDIGGGSTEFIIGQEYEPSLMESLYLGCVGYSLKYFPEGNIEAGRMKQALLAARKEIEVIAKPFRRHGWGLSFGSSGTAKALAGILTASGFSTQGITREGMYQLQDVLIRAKRVDQAELQGIKSHRTAVLSGGLVIMLAAFEELGIEQMDVADGALRLGVLYDLIGREVVHDKRTDTVGLFIRRYEADQAQAERVASLTNVLFKQLAGQGSEAHKYIEPYLTWAAKLHEIGQSISHNAYHRHSAYICQQADMPGFSRKEQMILSSLILGHTGKLPKVAELLNDSHTWQALLALRLACLLSRRREVEPPPPLSLSVHDTAIDVQVDARWLADNPLTEFSLQQEAQEWRKMGFELTLNPSY